MLISVEDLEAYAQVTFPEGVPLTSAEAAIAMASAQVEDHCKRSFALVEDDVITLRWRSRIVLPNPPVLEVASFLVDGRGVDYDVDDAGMLWPRATGTQISVTYTHGFAEIPQTVKLVVARVANRIMQNPQLRNTYTGPEGLTYSSPSDVGPRILTGDEMTALRRYALHRAA